MLAGLFCDRSGGICGGSLGPAQPAHWMEHAMNVVLRAHGLHRKPRGHQAQSGYRLAVPPQAGKRLWILHFSTQVSLVPRQVHGTPLPCAGFPTVLLTAVSWRAGAHYPHTGPVHHSCCHFSLFVGSGTASRADRSSSVSLSCCGCWFCFCPSVLTVAWLRLTSPREWGPLP